MATPAPGFAVGARASYEGLEILIFTERGAYRVQIRDGSDALSVNVYWVQPRRYS